MKRTILLLTALFICSTTMLFSQQLEIKTLGYTEQFPDGGLKSWDYIQHSNNVIVDVLAGIPNDQPYILLELKVKS